MIEDTDEEVKRELVSLFRTFLFWRMRELTDEFPSKIRISIFFSRGEGKSYSVETEAIWDEAIFSEAEKSYLNWEKNKIVNEAKKIMKGE